MQEELTATCDACGHLAILKEIDGLSKPDVRWPGVRVVEVIDCPLCGIREQPAPEFVGKHFS
jgi:hypothetical protein